MAGAEGLRRVGLKSQSDHGCEPVCEPKPEWDLGMKREILPQGERRWTAVLCADLVNFTGMSNTLGPERTYEVLGDVMGIARAEVERFGGVIIEYAGDAIFAAFGAPTAVENASLDACRAALEIQAEVARQRQRFERDFGLSPNFRIGLAGGPVVFGSLGHGDGLDVNVLGDAVNLATRLQKRTEAGRVVCSDAILSQVEGFVVTETSEDAELKGFEGNQSLHQIVSLLDSVSEFQGRMRRGSSVFLGRRGELAQLLDWLKNDAQHQPIIDVSGPAGVGKSRLLFEFTSNMDRSRKVYVGQCNLNIQQVTLAPILEIIRTAIGWQKGATQEAVEELLVPLVGADATGLPYLVQLVGGFERKEMEASNESALSTRKLSQIVLLEISRREECLFLIEDVHWIDPVSEAVLAALLEAEDNRHLRVVVTRRSHIPCVWNDDARARDLPLGPLEQTDVYTLICDLTGVNEASEDLVNLVTSKSESNPLFVEEILRYLQFAKGIQIEDQTAHLLPGDYDNIVSGNLQHLVLSRFDALPEEDRSYLVLAAAKGRQFSEAFLSQCFGGTADISSCLERAALAGLIELDPSGTALDWRFTHALIGDAIYQSLLGARRRKIHGLIAETLEQHSGNRLHHLAEELASHYQSAGDTKKAVHYLWRSAEQAFEVFSVVHADEQLNAAFDLIELDPSIVTDDEFGEMLFLWSRTLDIYGNFRKQTVILEQHLPRLRALGPSELLSLCTSMKALARCHAADFDRAQKLVDQSLEMAKVIGLEVPIIWAKVAQMRINVDGGFGSVEETKALYDEVKPAAEGLSDSHLIQLSTYVVMTAYRSVGALKKANEYVDWLTEYGTVNQSTRALAMASWARCINHLVREELDEALLAADDNLKHTVPPTGDWRVASVGKLVARLRRGDPDIEPEVLKPHIEVTASFEDASLGNALRCQYGIQLLMRGRIHQGWTWLTQAERDIQGAVSPEMGRFFKLVKAEFLLAVAGLMPSDGPSPKLGFRDIVTALGLRVGARKKSEKYLREFLSLIPSETGYFVARIKRDLGLIARSRGKEEDAQSFFDESVALYEAEEMFDAATSVARLKAN